MSKPGPLPKIGDRVQFGNEVYIVIEVNEETASASLNPETNAHIETVDIHSIKPIARHKRNGTGRLPS